MATGYMPTESIPPNKQQTVAPEVPQAGQQALPPSNISGPPDPTLPNPAFKSVEEKQAEDPKYLKTEVDQAMIGLRLEKDDQEIYARTISLPTFEKKLRETTEEYNKRVEELGENRATASMISMITHIAAGLYGINHGVDTSGVKFDPYDWSNEYNKIMDKYKISRDAAGAIYEAQATREQQIRSRVDRKAESLKQDEKDRKNLKILQGERAERSSETSANRTIQLAHKITQDAENLQLKYFNELQQANSSKKDDFRDKTYDDIGKAVLDKDFKSWQAGKSKEELKAMNTGIGAFGRDEEDEKLAYQSEVRNAVISKTEASRQRAKALLETVVKDPGATTAAPEEKTGNKKSQISMKTLREEAKGDPVKVEELKKGAVAEGYEIID